MNSKNLLLGVLVMLTIALASLALNEYNQVGILSAQLQSRTKTTQTVVTTQTSSSSRELSTGPILSILGAEIARVIVSPWPGQMGVNPITGKVYISDLFANTLTVLNASSRTILHTVTLPGTATSGIAIDTKNNLLYVPVSGCTNLHNATNPCDSAAGQKLKGGIVRVDGRNDSIIGEFGIDVRRLAINPATLMLYGIWTDYSFSNNPTGYLLGIDERSGAIASNVSLSRTPLDIAVDPQTNIVYVSACGQLSLACINSEVLAINVTSNRVQWTAPLGFDAINFPIVVNPATNSVFVMGLTGASLTLDSINEVTGKLIYSSDR